MIKRIYIDNFRCMVNFELTLGPMNLLLGPNGTGKSTVFDVLWRLQCFLMGDWNVASLFGASTRTRWDRRRLQRFEIDMQGPSGLYRYLMSVEHMEDGSRARLIKEALLLDGQPLFDFEDGTAHLFRDNHSKGPEFPADWSRSVMAGIPERGDNTKLTWFRNAISKLVVVRINPNAIESESAGFVATPKIDMSDFVSWFHTFFEEHRDREQRLLVALQGPLPGFGFFTYPRAGESHRVLKLQFSGDSERNQKYPYRLDELSDGQRVLIILYTLLHWSVADGVTVCIDEPDNYLALPEVQPWLLTLNEMCVESSGQAILISHHPELIGFLASDCGLWFSRDRHGPVRVARVSDDGESGLPISELVARGWMHGT